jgi:hypothetical protein
VPRIGASQRASAFVPTASIRRMSLAKCAAKAAMLAQDLRQQTALAAP